MARAASGQNDRPSTLILDLRQVTGFDLLMAPLLADLAVEMASRDGEGLAWSDVGEHAEAVDAVDEELRARGLTPLPRFPELDAALEWAEGHSVGPTWSRRPPRCGSPTTSCSRG